MALINWSEPAFKANRDVKVFDNSPQLQHSEKPRTIWVDVEYGHSGQIAVNKKTHRIRFQEETESSVVIVIEPKEGA